MKKLHSAKKDGAYNAPSFFGEQNYFKNSFGSMLAPSFLTEKCRCGAPEASLSAVVPTEPMTCPALTYYPSPTEGTLWRLA